MVKRLLNSTYSSEIIEKLNDEPTPVSSLDLQKSLLLVLLTAVSPVWVLTSEPGVCRTPDGADDYSYRLGTRYNYRVRIRECLTGSEPRKRLVVEQNGHIRLDLSGFDYALVDPTASEPNLGVQGSGRLHLFDLNGDGNKEIIIRLWSGGAHCCYTYDIYSLSSKLHHIWHFAGFDGHMLKMEPAGINKLPVLYMEDATFRYWRTGVYQFPAIPLQWNGKTIVPVRANMRKPLDAKLRNEQAQAEDQLRSGCAEGLYQCLVSLYYRGHADEARRWLAHLNLQGESAETLRSDFVQQLGKSPFYRDVRAINSGKL